jgi:hypothetical protein
MPDALTIAGPMVASGMIYQVAVSIGLPSNLAVPVAVCAAVGASLALSRGERIEVNLRSLLAALSVYLFSLLFGVTVGTAAAMGGLALLPEKVSAQIPVGSVVMAAVLITAAFGVSTILPFAMRLVERRTGGDGGGNA